MFPSSLTWWQALTVVLISLLAGGGWTLGAWTVARILGRLFR